MLQTTEKRQSRLRVADIAKHAGVSTATVDRVIHQRPGVKPHTATHIRTVIQEMESSRNGEVKNRRPFEQLNFDVILPKGANSFFNRLEEQIQAVSDTAGNNVIFTIRRIEGFNPRVLAESIRNLSGKSNGIAVVGIEDPMVREAVNHTVDLGVPVVTLVSDLSNSRHQAFIGMDNRAAGRTAGYLMGRFAPDQGTVLMIAGSMSLRDHEEREIGFRRVLGEYNDKLKIIARLDDHDDYRTTYEETRKILRRNSDLVGIYNIGAGNRGIANALEETGRQHDIVFIGHELTSFTRQYLIDGTMDVVIDQNPLAEAEQLKNTLIDLNQNDPLPVDSTLQQVTVIIRENLH